ncbi:hypothetical protein NKR23_g5102 [Pleurostoma richardsiae]|uniref:Uncharacterized protein n=1 Tax=Pleurostoma richardsiae TaxID=41990 RepID=A0AA38RTQ3_9PEZI|nr:hypothetical protein NKR23_g5102 [Pleurostoma richardsiae]
MTPSMLSMNVAVAPSASYPTDAVLEDLSRQMAFSARRASRGSNGQRCANPMRVVKPRSANNSPQSSILQQRRRTLMADAIIPHRNTQILERPYLPTPGAEACFDGLPTSSKKSARPLSWHPSSYMPQPQLQSHQSPTPQYPFPAYESEFFQSHQFPPTPAVYSGYTSPSVAFSPLSLPYSGYDASQYFPSGSWSVSAPQATTPSLVTTSSADSALCNFDSIEPLDYGVPTYVSATWNATTPGALSHFTAPPTPENFPLPQQSQPAISAEESIPYLPLENDDESGGEVLVGMGLYDSPEKDVDLFRSTVSQLLGSPYPKPTGKGLKLEDAWEPPAMVDDEDDDEDADGEEQEEDRA